MKRKGLTPLADVSSVSDLFAKSNITGAIRPKVNLASLIPSATRNISGRWGLFVEAVTNSEDYKAANIWISVLGKGQDQEIIFLDDGEGMGPDRRQAFMSVAFSTSKDDEEKRGRHGLGTKRMSAEFKFCEVIDISQKENDGKMRILSFGWDEWLEKLIAEEDIPVGELKRDHALLGLSPGKTGVRIRLWGPRGDRSYTAEQVMNHLGNQLAPWVAKKVRVSSDTRDWKPLKTRELLGDEIEHRDNHPVLGNVYVRIYTPKIRTETDSLRIGALGPVCDFSEFRNQLPEYLYQQLPRVFSNPLVCGIIDVSKFNKYSDNSRTNFDASLFESELMMAFINYLSLELEDEVEERLGEVESEVDDQFQRALLEEVADLCSALGGERFTGPVPPKNIILTVKSLELLSGEKASISVRRHPETTKKFVWNSKNSGGSVNTNEGDEVVYTAGDNVGEYVLGCADAQNSEIFSEVKICIVPRKLLRLSPAQATLEIGETLSIKAINYDDDSSGAENLVWATDESEGKCRPTRGAHINYQAGNRLGTYEVSCTDRQNRRKRATCIVTVVKEKPERDKRTQDDTSVVIDGVRYRLFSMNNPNSPLLSQAYGTKKTKYVDIHINFKHPVLIQARSEGKFSSRQVAIRQVLMHHIELIKEGEPIHVLEINHLMGELNTKIIGRIQEKSE